MQTFLPYPNLIESVASLDQQRLGKQRVETLQMMKALITGTGWIHHPCTRMWRGYEPALLAYQEATTYEWIVVRGFKDTCMQKTLDIYSTRTSLFDRPVVMPPWLGDDRFHLSHQSNLVRKNATKYGPMFPGVVADLPYVWPVTIFS